MSQAQTSQSAMADTTVRATAEHEQHAASAVEYERDWKQLRDEERWQREKLQEILEEFKQSSAPVTKR